MKSSSRALKGAHILQKNAVKIMPNSKHQVPQNWSQMLKLAWYFENLRERMKNGIVVFSYWKKNGEIREAIGTLCPLLIPEEDKPKCENEEMRKCENFSSFTYYDINKKAWRSFAVTHFIGFVTIYELKERA